jgi:hypothetical protein
MAPMLSPNPNPSPRTEGGSEPVAAIGGPTTRGRIGIAKYTAVYEPNSLPRITQAPAASRDDASRPTATRRHLALPEAIRAPPMIGRVGRAATPRRALHGRRRPATSSNGIMQPAKVATGENRRAEVRRPAPLSAASEADRFIPPNPYRVAEPAAVTARCCWQHGLERRGSQGASTTSGAR